VTINGSGDAGKDIIEVKNPDFVNVLMPAVTAPNSDIADVTEGQAASDSANPAYSSVPAVLVSGVTCTVK